MLVKFDAAPSVAAQISQRLSKYLTHVGSVQDNPTVNGQVEPDVVQVLHVLA